ncbi:MAG TPA: hypothetical protein VJ904_00270 [Tichowtungia sp.]|nr:hypothetical protein [Tichowtungia sp.]
MNRTMRENTAAVAAAALLIGGLVLFGCSRSEPAPETAPHEQQNGHDHGTHTHD